MTELSRADVEAEIRAKEHEWMAAWIAEKFRYTAIQVRDCTGSTFTRNNS